MHTGLPPGPIGNPGLASIKAAANPAKTRLPLLRRRSRAATGTHKFSETDAEFQRDVDELQPRARRARRQVAHRLLTTYAGVLGFPVAHSRSPAMKNAAFAELGLDWRYVQLPRAARALRADVRALPGSGYRGANVTIPHKEAALALCRRARARRPRRSAPRTRSRSRTAAIARRQHRRRRLARRARASRRGRRARARRRRAGPGGGLGAARGRAREVASGTARPSAQRARRRARRRGSPTRPRARDLLVNATVGRAATASDALDGLPLAWTPPGRGGPRLRRRAHAARALGGRARRAAWSTAWRCSCARARAASSAGPAGAAPLTHAQSGRDCPVHPSQA